MELFPTCQGHQELECRPDLNHALCDQHTAESQSSERSPTIALIAVRQNDFSSFSLALLSYLQLKFG